MCKKTFVLDTNILLDSPTAIFAFDDNKVVIPEAVVDELDHFKKDKTELGHNARETARILEVLRHKGDITKGVSIDNTEGGILCIEVNHRDVKIPEQWSPLRADNRILQVCKALKEQEEDVYLITKDIFLRIKADMLGIVSEDIKYNRVAEIDKQYKGREEIYVSSEDIDNFYKNKYMNIDTYLKFEENQNIKLFMNEFVIFS